MAETLQLMAAVYPSRDQATTIFDTLSRMHRNGTISLADAAIATKAADGKVHMEETDELTTREGARRGALAAAVVGLIFPPSLIGSLLAGGAIGGLIGKLRDTGIKNAELAGIVDGLTPGKSAVIALAEGEWVVQVQGALQGYEGTLITHVLNEDEVKDIYLESEKSR